MRSDATPHFSSLHLEFHDMRLTLHLDTALDPDTKMRKRRSLQTQQKSYAEQIIAFQLNAVVKGHKFILKKFQDHIYHNLPDWEGVPLVSYLVAA